MHYDAKNNHERFKRKTLDQILTSCKDEGKRNRGNQRHTKIDNLENSKNAFDMENKIEKRC